MAGFGTLPQAATLEPSPFHASASEAELADFKQLLRLSKVGPQTYENLQEDGRFGVTHKWMTEAKQYWQEKYDW